MRYLKEHQAKDKAERRKLLQAKKENEYQILCQQHLSHHTIMRNAISAEVIKEFGLSLEAFNASGNHFKSQPTSVRILTEAGKQVEKSERDT